MSDMEMQAGRLLDSLIGGKVMGLDIVEDTLPHLPKYYIPEYNRTIFTDVPAYSTTWEGMRLVIEEMQRRGFRFELYLSNEQYLFQAIFTRGFDFARSGRINSAPQAVCHVALLALEEESK